jgi:hypothetical protein
MNLESSFDLQRGQEQIERTIGYAEEMVSRQSAADFNHSLSREDLSLYKQRQLDPPLRWGDEQPDWDERFAEVAQDTSRVPHQNVFPEDLEVQKELGPQATGPGAAGESAEVTAEAQSAAATEAPAGESLRFMKPKLVAEGSEGVENGVWDGSTDLAEGDEEVAGWEDDVSTPAGHLAGAV